GSRGAGPGNPRGAAGLRGGRPRPAPGQPAAGPGARARGAGAFAGRVTGVVGGTPRNGKNCTLRSDRRWDRPEWAELAFPRPTTGVPDVIPGQVGPNPTSVSPTAK